MDSFLNSKFHSANSFKILKRGGFLEKQTKHCFTKKTIKEFKSLSSLNFLLSSTGALVKHTSATLFRPHTEEEEILKK